MATDRVGHFHDLGQLPAHVLGVDENDQRAMRAHARLAQNTLALSFKPRLGGVNIGHFKSNMVLPTQRVALQPFANSGVWRGGLQQFDLGASTFRQP